MIIKTDVKYVNAVIINKNGEKKDVSYPLKKRIKDIVKYIKNCENDDIIVVDYKVYTQSNTYDIPQDVLNDYLVENE